MLGYELEDFQATIVEEVFSDRRETVVLIPRGCGKSTARSHTCATTCSRDRLGHYRATALARRSLRLHRKMRPSGENAKCPRQDSNLRPAA
jgi:hypothetical protein